MDGLLGVGDGDGDGVGGIGDGDGFGVGGVGVGVGVGGVGVGEGVGIVDGVVDTVEGTEGCDGVGVGWCLINHFSFWQWTSFLN